MKNPITNQIFNHLEFLWYAVEDLSDNKDIDVLIWRNENRSNLVLRITKNWTIIIIARYNLSDSKEIITENFLKQLNIVNSKSLFTKRYYEEDETITLAIETFSIDYNKQIFWMIIDTMENEIVNYIKHFDN